MMSDTTTNPTRPDFPGAAPLHEAAMHASQVLAGIGLPGLAHHLAEAAFVLTPDAQLPVLRMTWAELQLLPEYSGSVPTGTAEGKRWRRNRDAGGRAGYGTPASRWMVGEYGAPDGDVVPITWYEVEVEGVHRPARTPAQDAREAIGHALGSLHVVNARCRAIARWFGQPGGEALDVVGGAAAAIEARLEAHRALVKAAEILRPLPQAARGTAAPMGPGRCLVCDWPYAESREQGCAPGDCSYRPTEGTDEHRRITARRAALSLTPKEMEHIASRDMGSSVAEAVSALAARRGPPMCPPAFLLRCTAERKNAPGRACGGYVGAFATARLVLGLVPHSRDAPAGHDVVGCIRCGALHVLEPAD